MPFPNAPGMTKLVRHLVQHEGNASMGRKAPGWRSQLPKDANGVVRQRRLVTTRPRMCADTIGIVVSGPMTGSSPRTANG
jgi:hypothetical protein